MQYKNGKDIFPERLLKQIQKYVSGELIYIPSMEKKKDWGEVSGYKKILQKRNYDIQLKFRNGVTFDQLAEEYCLSYETIKKIAYSKKEVLIMDYKATLSSAKAYAANGKLEKWIHEYLCSDGHNKEFSDGLKLFDRYFLGPVKMPLSFFKRCCGPEDGLKWQIPAEPFEKKVLSLMDVIKNKTDLPPLIVSYYNGEFELNDGNHRLEAYNRLGINEYFVIVWITEKDDYADFMEKYKQYLE